MKKDNKTNLLHVLEDYSIQSGGVARVVHDLSKNNNLKKTNINIYSSNGLLLKNSLLISKKKINSLYWNFDHKKKLESLILKSDIVHNHGVWSSVNYYACLMAIKNNVPLIFSAHGMLEPWLWFNQGSFKYVKKKLYWDLVIKKKLSNAKLIHGSTSLECDNLRKLFPYNEIINVPNATNINAYNDNYFKGPKKKQIIYLGRVEPKKGTHLLIEAFSRANLSSEWKLLIVGPFWSNSYQKKLINYVISNKLESRVKFINGVYDKEKQSLLKNSWIHVLPTYSDTPGLVNLEAASEGLPSITTYNTGLLDWNEGGGKLINPVIDELILELKKTCQWSLEERNDRGKESYLLVKKKYSYDVVLPIWNQIYKTINEK